MSRRSRAIRDTSSGTFQDGSSKEVQTESRSGPRMRKFMISSVRHFKTIQFIVVLIMCVGMLMFQAGQCVQKYLDKHTGTGDKYIHLSKVSLPVMTVCPGYPYKLEKLRVGGIPAKGLIQFNAKWISNDTSMSAAEFYDSVIYHLHELVDKIYIYTEGEGTNNLLYKPNDTVCGQPLFKVKQYYYNGDCFSLALPTCITETGVLEITIDFFDKADVFIHHEGQFLSPNSRSRVDIHKGKFAKIAVNHEVVQLLGEDGSCVKIDDGKSDFPYNSFDDCMTSRLRDLMLAEVNCTIPWLPDKSRICVDEVKRKRSFEIYAENRRNQRDLCPNSCLFTNMYFGPPVTGTQNLEHSHLARIVLYFRRDIKVTTEYYLYLPLSMVAEIGGYVGLLLGMSLFNVADLNNALLDWIYTKKGENRSAKGGEVKPAIITVSQCSEEPVNYMDSN